MAAAPEDYTLYLNIYECYESQDLSALGDEYLQTALSIVPEEAEDYYHMGQIYYYLQQYDQAQSALLKPQEEGYLPALYLQGKNISGPGGLRRSPFCLRIHSDGTSGQRGKL